VTDQNYVRVPYNFLSECYEFDGVDSLNWKLRPESHFKTLNAWKSWKTRCFGKSLGSFDKQGYQQVALHYKGKIQRLHVHRIIMSLVLGRDLKRSEVVDHIDGNRANNSLFNLRLVDHSANAINTGLKKTNTSGVKNISWSKQKQKWQVSGQTGRKRTHVGFYKTLEEAVVAQTAFYEEGL